MLLIIKWVFYITFVVSLFHIINNPTRLFNGYTINTSENFDVDGIKGNAEVVTRGSQKTQCIRALLASLVTVNAFASYFVIVKELELLLSIPIAINI